MRSSNFLSEAACRSCGVGSLAEPGMSLRSPMVLLGSVGDADASTCAVGMVSVSVWNSKSFSPSSPSTPSSPPSVTPRHEDVTFCAELARNLNASDDRRHAVRGDDAHGDGVQHVLEPTVRHIGAEPLDQHGDVLIGDVDGDGRVAVADARRALERGDDFLVPRVAEVRPGDHEDELRHAVVQEEVVVVLCDALREFDGRDRGQPVGHPVPAVQRGRAADVDDLGDVVGVVEVGVGRARVRRTAPHEILLEAEDRRDALHAVGLTDAVVIEQLFAVLHLDVHVFGRDMEQAHDLVALADNLDESVADHPEILVHRGDEILNGDVAERVEDLRKLFLNETEPDRGGDLSLQTGRVVGVGALESLGSGPVKGMLHHSRVLGAVALGLRRFHGLAQVHAPRGAMGSTLENLKGLPRNGDLTSLGRVRLFAGILGHVDLLPIILHEGGQPPVG